MLSISNPMSAANLENYFLRLAQKQYYASALEEPGHWYGEGAARLGLNGTVAREPFHNLLAGRSPDGRQPLVQNAGKPDRQAGWDLTFSAPKSVSVFWATVPESMRSVVEEAHRHAVEQTLAHLEKTAGITRRGKGGKIKERAALTFALFQHGSSRADDPQLHLHAVLSNVGLRRDGTAGALQSRDFFRLKMQLGALYQKKLAARLHSRLGLKMERAKIGYRIAGVPPSLCKAFSKRRQTMEKSMQARGVSGAVAAKETALRTRQRKKNVPRAELFAAWQQEAAAHGWTQADSLKLVHPIQKQDLARESSETRRWQEAKPALSAEHETSGSLASRDLVIKAKEIPPGQPLPSRAERPAPAAPEPVAPKELSAGAKQASSPVAPSSQQSLPTEGKVESAATPQNSAESVRTGFEDYPDFVGPRRPDDKPAWAKSALPSRDFTDTAPRPRPFLNEVQPAATLTNSVASDLTGFENYPDFVGPPAPSLARGRRKMASPPHNSTHAEQRPEERTGQRRPTHDHTRRADRQQGPETKPTEEHTRTEGRRPQRGQTRTARARPTRWTKPNPSRARRRLPLPKSPVTVQWRRLFPNAPSWSPARKWTAPVLVLKGRRSRPRRQPTWGRVLWSKNLIVGQVRVQQRRLFPKAPGWSPVRKLTLPAVRVVAKTAPPPRRQTLQRSY